MDTKLSIVFFVLLCFTFPTDIYQTVSYTLNT